MFDYLKLGLNYILPKKLLTRFAGWCAEIQGGWFTKAMIDVFVWLYDVDMSVASNPDTASYYTFNDFFVRKLKDNSRPIDLNNSLLSMPADGIISQIGCIKGDQIFQAKYYYYSLYNLLAGNNNLAFKFINGKFITIYLTPRDYHRVHMPCNGILCEMTYVPGNLYSVNPLIIRSIPNIFTRNERVICLFDTDHGPMVQILVGATIVGSIETSWAGTVTSKCKKEVKKWCYPKASHSNAVVLLKGQEMGRFKLGSTVINLFAPNRIQLVNNLKVENKINFGQLLGFNLSYLNDITQSSK